MNDSTIVKTAVEIGSLAGQLTPNNQFYVLNTINTLLYSQKINETEKPIQPQKKQHRRNA